jgi:hypothetical protein
MLQYLINDTKLATLDKFVQYLKDLDNWPADIAHKRFHRIGMSADGGVEVGVHLKGSEVRAVAPALLRFAEKMLGAGRNGERQLQADIKYIELKKHVQYYRLLYSDSFTEQNLRDLDALLDDHRETFLKAHRNCQEDQAESALYGAAFGDHRIIKTLGFYTFDKMVKYSFPDIKTDIA